MFVFFIEWLKCGLVYIGKEAALVRSVSGATDELDALGIVLNAEVPVLHITYIGLAHVQVLQVIIVRTLNHHPFLVEVGKLVAAGIFSLAHCAFTVHAEIVVSALEQEVIVVPVIGIGQGECGTVAMVRAVERSF